ncbi:mobilization protein [Clostridia bacterium]|nr:mobilization protein [Clostridia bacterium]
MAERKRNNNISFRVTDEEKERIFDKMKQAGISNLRSYMLKMAVDGFVLRTDLSCMNTLISLLSNATSNLNQIAKRVNETGNLYAVDVEDLRKNYANVREETAKVYKSLLGL